MGKSSLTMYSLYLAVSSSAAWLLATFDLITNPQKYYVGQTLDDEW